MRLSAAVLGTLALAFFSHVAFVCHAQDFSKHVAGLDVTKSNINKTLEALPADARVLLEFYATWCPACRAFKPEYDKVAKFFSTVPAGAANKVYAFRLDCAIDPDVCGTYQVAAYPTMYAGTAADALGANVAKLTKFDYGKYSRNAPGVVKFVAEHFKLDLVYVEAPVVEKPVDPAHPGKGVTAVAVDMQWTFPDVQLATAQLFDSITAQDILHNNQQQRLAFEQMLQVWADAHPVPACKAGASDILKKLPVVWPAGKPGITAELKALSVCGDCGVGPTGSCTGATPVTALTGSSTSKATTPAPELIWVACRGSKPEQRGFTCALWLLFHTTAARVTDGDGAALFMTSLRGFAHHFFQCAVCKNHFERVTDAADAAVIRSRRDAVLWVWKAHNEVNERLAKIEAKYGHSSTGDAAYPKVHWPTASACPQCRLPVLQKKSDERGGADGGRRTGESQGGSEAVQWNEEEVYRFLMKWYGGEPGSGSPADAAGPVMLGHSDDDEAMSHGVMDDSPGGVLALLSNVLGVAGVAAAAGVLFYCYGRSQRRRLHTLKGPGAMGHHHKVVQVKHGVAGVGHHSNGDAAWGASRYPQKKGFE